MTTAEDTLLHRRAPNLSGMSRNALLLGLAAFVLAVLLGLLTDMRHFFHGYLVSYLLFTGLTLGCLSLGMLNSVTGGRWGLVIRPILVAGAKALPLMFVLFIPLLFNLPANYPWARKYAEHDEILLHQSAWMNTWFFIGRAVFYFAVWTGLAFAVAGWARRKEDEHQEAEDDEEKGLISTGGGKITRITAPGLMLYGITVTFAAIDWAMSLEPRWFSTIFGLAYIVGQGLTALAFATFVLVLLTQYTGRIHKRRDEAGRVDATTLSAGEPAHGPLVQPGDFADLGNLLMAFSMLWAYMAFSQFLIQWAGNLPSEVQYFVPRIRTGWRWVGLLLIVCHFAIPFFTLFSRNVKRSGRSLGMVAGWILVMRMVDWIWIVEPTVRYNTPDVNGNASASLANVGLGPWVLMDLILVAAIGGLWVAYFTWQLSGKIVLPTPVADPHGHGGGHGHAPDPHATTHGTTGHTTTGGGGAAAYDAGSAGGQHHA